MFDVGNKIVVTGSSIKKGKPGPIINSIGYIKRVNDVFIELDTYFITTMEIIFCRFGNERKYRTETKLISILFPNKIEDTNDFSFTKQQSFLRKLSNKTNLNVKKVFGTKNIFTISPVYTNVFEINITYHERMSYLLSLWSYVNLYQSIKVIRKTNWYYKYKIKNIKDIIYILAKGLNDTEYKHDIAYRLASNIKEYEIYIMVLKLITLNSKTPKSVCSIINKNNIQIIEKGPKFIYKTLYLNLFNNYYNVLAEKFINKQQDLPKQQSIKTIVTNLNYARQRLITNGQKYI